MRLFGTDGVRGRAGEELNVINVLKIAIASGIYFRKNSKTNKILVGKDTRRSGYMIENALVSGLTSIGYDVIQVGPMPTPAIAFLTEDLRCDGGIMISASHNPYDDNGIKFFNSNGFKLDESSEKEIENIFFNENILFQHFKSGRDIGSSKRIDDVIGRYIVHIKNSFPKDLNLYGLRIIVDTANGAAYKVAPTIFRELGADVIVINDEPNGFNINEACGALFPTTLSEYVKKYRADLGIALDGDADRLIVVDDLGNVIDGDKLIGAVAIHLQKEGNLKNSVVGATVMSNLGLEEYLLDHNIKLLRSAVGDKYLLEIMQSNGAVFGGEQSGHIIFSDYAKSGDGILSALQVLALIVRSKKEAHKVLNPFTLYPQILENIKVKDKIPLENLVGFEDILRDLEAKKIRHLIRYSGTENKLRVLLEGKEQKILENEIKRLVDFFKSHLI